MNRNSKILVIIDKGCLRQPALDRAIALYRVLKKTDAQCSITAIMPVKKEFFSITSLLAVENQTLEKSFVQKQERWLKAYLQVNAMDIKIDSKVIYSKDPSKEIISFANDNEISLIIKSNEYHGFLDTLFSGSIDIEMLRQAEVPVLIAKNNIFRLDSIIAVAIDLSDPDDERISAMNLKLLREAQLLSKISGMKIALINAITPLMPPVVVDIPSYTPDALYGQSVKERCSIALDFAKRHNIDRHNCILCEGEFTDVLYDVCSKLKPSVLFLGSQARSGLSSMLIGNVCEKLADLVSCDVAVITRHTVEKVKIINKDF